MHTRQTEKVSEQQPAKPRNLKVNNRKTVLDLLRRFGEMSASELSETANLSRTTIMKTLNHFIENGFVLSEGKGESTNEGGKKPEIFSFNAKIGYICTLAIRADRISCSITDLSARVITRMKMPHSPNEKLMQIVENASILTMAVIDASFITIHKLRGIVVCIDGVVDFAQSVVHYATHFPSWGKNIALGELIKIALGKNVPIICESSVRMLGFAELRENPAFVSKNVVTFFGEMGVGACIMRQGRVVHGKHAFLGELGHMIVSPNGAELCYCGNRGCFEMMVSSMRVLLKARREHGEWPESKLFAKAHNDELEFCDIFAAADCADSFAKYLADFLVKHFAIVLHNTIISHDPDIIVLQGCYSNIGNYFINSLRERVRNMQLAGFNETAHIRYSLIDMSKAYFTGPAYYMIEEIFRNEAIYET